MLVPAANHVPAMISLPRNALGVDERHVIEINHFRTSDNECLFNEISYFRLHSTSASDCYMQLVSPANDKVLASIAFYEDEENAFKSPKRGTYGGMVVYSTFDLKLLDRFFSVAFSYLAERGAVEVNIKSPPFSHDLALSSMTLNMLLRHGFLMQSHELNYDMRVDKRPFLDRVSYGNNKRIRKCLRDGVVAEQVSADRLPMVYEVLKENRLRRGFPISMSAEQLGEMAAIFPERLFLFAAWENDRRQKMIASAVCLAVRPSIMYVFYWGDVAGVESYSPIALLASIIHDFCQNRGYSLLDAGTSTLAGEPNYGLINFKQNLGFSASVKPTYVWKK